MRGRSRTAGLGGSHRAVALSQPNGSWGSGYCEATVDGNTGDCELGQKGSLGGELRSWSKPEVAREKCMALCARCARCRFFSFSVKFRDCSWYHSCTRPLKQDVESFHTFKLQQSARGVSRRAGASIGARLNRTRMVRRRALHLAGKWPWLTPTATARVAVLLFGKVLAISTCGSYLIDLTRLTVNRLLPAAAASYNKHAPHESP